MMLNGVNVALAWSSQRLHSLYPAANGLLNAIFLALGVRPNAPTGKLPGLIGWQNFAFILVAFLEAGSGDRHIGILPGFLEAAFRILSGLPIALCL